VIQTVPMKRVTIIGDETVKYRILHEIERLGASGYTDCSAHGKGARGIRPRHAEPANARIEVIATAEVAGKILEHIAEHYLNNYAMIAFLSDVEVLQGEKFGAKAQ
jgi:nitrogen regulatory protein P-II 2